MTASGIIYVWLAFNAGFVTAMLMASAHGDER